MLAPLDNSLGASSRTRVASSFQSPANLQAWPGLPLLLRRLPVQLLGHLAALHRLEPRPGPHRAHPQAEREQALGRKEPIRAERELTLRMFLWATPRPLWAATSSAWAVRSIKLL